jgi:hypothetical protein
LLACDAQVFNVFKLSHEQQGGVKVADFNMINAPAGLICCAADHEKCHTFPLHSWIA